MDQFLQVSDINKVVVWMVWRISILPLISNSPSQLSKPIKTFPTVHSKIDLIIIFMFHRFSSALAKSK